MSLLWTLALRGLPLLGVLVVVLVLLVVALGATGFSDRVLNASVHKPHVGVSAALSRACHSVRHCATMCSESTGHSPQGRARHLW